MAFELKVPDIGEGLTEAEIVEWIVDVGATVAANEPIVSVETAKAVVEISAPRPGVLLHQGAPEGTVLEVGSLLAVIGDPGETWVAGEAVAGGGEEPVPAAAPRRAAPTAPVRAVPLVRKLAANLGVDLATVSGSGPNGQITRGDVEAAAAAAPPAGITAADAAAEMSATRRAIARNMARSWSEIPHVTVWGPADGTRLLARRSATGAPFEALLVRALLGVLADHPDFNARFDGTTLTHSGGMHIGIAIDTAAGLVVPVLRDAQALTDEELAAEIDRLIAAARHRRLTPDEMAGNTFTISNVGAVGGGYGTPIIPHGTTAIVSVGRAKDDVVVRDKAIAIAPVLPVALSFDHRVIDGASASQFLNRFVAEIEGIAG